MTTTPNSPATSSPRRKTAPGSVQKSLWRDAGNIPNLITISRLLLALVLFALIDRGGFWISSAVLFLLAASTDALDGYIARRYRLVTVLGRIMDPFVDKIIVGGTFLFLVAEPSSGVTAWMAVVVIGREMFVTSLRGFLEQQGLNFSASWSGKLKMALQCLAVPLALLSLDERCRYDWFLLLRDVFLWTAVAATLFSGLIYVVRATTLLQGDKEEMSGRNKAE